MYNHFPPGAPYSHGKDFDYYFDGPLGESIELDTGLFVRGGGRARYGLSPGAYVEPAGNNTGVRIFAPREYYREAQCGLTIVVDEWASGTPSQNRLQGFGFFLRYNSESDLYVTTVRRYGEAILQRKRAGVYTVFHRAPHESLKLGVPYRLTAKVVDTDRGSCLSFSIKPIGQGTIRRYFAWDPDRAFLQGAVGLRIDRLRGRVLEWKCKTIR